MKKTAIILFLMEPVFFLLLQFLKGLEILYSFLGIFESSLFGCEFMGARLSLEACSNVHIQNGELTEFRRIPLLHFCSKNSSNFRFCISWHRNLNNSS